MKHTNWQPVASQMASGASNATFVAVIVAQLLLLAFVFNQNIVPLQDLLRDGGAISDLGVLLWISTAAICGLVALVLWLTAMGNRDVAIFAVAAAFSCLLAVDDMFLLHDGLLPRLGIPEIAVFAVYVLAAFIYAGFAWRRIFIAAPWHLVLTGAVFAVGLAIDVTKDLASGPLLDSLRANDQLRIMGEDGFKFIGIGCWFTLHLRAALTTLERAIRFGA